MKMINQLISFFVLSLCCTAQAQAFERTDYWSGEQAVSCHGGSEMHCIDQVITNEQGVFLLIDGLWLGAESLQVVPDGIFVLEEGHWMSLEDAVRCNGYYVWQCRNCGARNPQGTSSCLRCRAPRGS